MSARPFWSSCFGHVPESQGLIVVFLFYDALVNFMLEVILVNEEVMYIRGIDGHIANINKATFGDVHAVLWFVACVGRVEEGRFADELILLVTGKRKRVKQGENAGTGSVGLHGC